jgi:hypothetical protein
MLAGVRPYTKSTAYEWIMLHTEATPPDLQPYGVAPQLARLVRRMLARQPELRQQTMRDVLQDLRTAARGMKNVHAFLGEGTMVAPENLTTDIAATPMPPPAAPPPAAPPPSYAAAYQQQPAAPPPSYAAAYQQQPAAPPAYAPTPPAYQQQPGYPPAPYRGPQPPSNPARAQQLRFLGNVALGLAVIVIYFAYYWQDTLRFFRTFPSLFRFGP